MHQHWHGLAHLSTWWNAVRLRHIGQPANTTIVITGDSLTVGSDINDARFRLANLLPALSARASLPNVSAVALGHGGEHTGQWLASHIPETLTANPCLYVWRWGMNETKRAAPENIDQEWGQIKVDFESDLRAGIARLRDTGASPAGKSPAQMSILLLSPNVAMFNGRTPQRIVELSAIIKTVAADTECAFFDIANAFPEVVGQPYMLDGLNVHPLETFEAKIANAIAPILFLESLAAAVGLPPPPPSSQPVAVTFDGTNDNLARGAELTGNADGKKGLVSLWCRINGGDGTHRVIFRNQDGYIHLARDAANKFKLSAANSGAANILTLVSNTAYTAGATWRHVLMSWDLATGAAHLYINDAADLAASPTVENSTIDYTRGNFHVGSAQGANRFWNGDLYDVYINLAGYLDLSQAANRAKFIADGSPVDLGTAGQLPTGNPPIVLLCGPASAFRVNRGTGGDFTVSGGGLANAPTQPQ